MSLRHTLDASVPVPGGVRRHESVDQHCRPVVYWWRRAVDVDVEARNWGPAADPAAAERMGKATKYLVAALVILATGGQPNVFTALVKQRRRPGLQRQGQDHIAGGTGRRRRTTIVSARGSFRRPYAHLPSARPGLAMLFVAVDAARVPSPRPGSSLVRPQRGLRSGGRGRQPHEPGCGSPRPWARTRTTAGAATASSPSSYPTPSATAWTTSPLLANAEQPQPGAAPFLPVRGPAHQRPSSDGFRGLGTADASFPSGRPPSQMPRRGSGSGKT